MRVGVLLNSLLVCAMLSAACAPGGDGAAGPESGRLAQPHAKKRITIAGLAQVTVLNPDLGGSSTSGTVAEMFSAGLVDFDPAGTPSAQLAEAAPTLDNGLWRLFPDGRMETTWTIREGARWHDGVPMTADDLLFTLTVSRESPEFAGGKNVSNALIESAAAPDLRTLKLTWTAPFIQADWMFSYRQSVPLPKHLLEPSFLADKANFPNLRYWTSEFVGNGPFVVRQFEPRVSLLLTAFEDYVLGRPKLDEIEVLFIPDSNTLAANVLAGTVDLTIGPGLSIEQALTMQEKAPNFKVIYSGFFYTQGVIYPQYLNPDPLIQLNPRFRQALAQAIDRQEMVDSIQAGLGAVAKAITAPTDPDWPEVEPRVVDYPYDPRRAAQMVQELGYGRGADGLFRGPDGKELTVEVRGASDVYERTMLAVADYWNRIGVSAQPFVPPRNADRSVGPTRPAFSVGALQTTLDRRFHSSEIPTAENRYTGSNVARYSNPEMDQLIDRYFTTVPRAERALILADIVHWMTSQALVIHLFFNISPQMQNTRLKNVTPRTNLTQTWRAHLMELE